MLGRRSSVSLEQRNDSKHDPNCSKAYRPNRKPSWNVDPGIRRPKIPAYLAKRPELFDFKIQRLVFLDSK